ncbi:hypothetical protein [Janthinobacterium sp. PSPC3-1]|uniref:hypothetical protein n=1 Tax=Janthinobacterium sp. PSPC3-1 TaxID=2804653 RepID=UPI003CF31873
MLTIEHKTRMKQLARQASIGHYCAVAVVILLVAILNYIMWQYESDTRFETLETLLLRFLRPAVTFGTIGLALSLAMDHHTMRVLKKLEYYKN